MGRGDPGLFSTTDTETSQLSGKDSRRMAGPQLLGNRVSRGPETIDRSWESCVNQAAPYIGLPCGGTTKGRVDRSIGFGFKRPGGT